MKKVIIIFCLFYAVGSFAQNKWIKGSLFSTAAYYLDDKKTGDFLEDDRFRSNNYLRLNGGIGRFSAGVQIEGYVPKSLLNFSPGLNKKIGFGTYFLNYKSNKLDVTLGSFYEHFGSGMILRFWEDKQLGIDNSLNGVRTVYSPFLTLDITALYGKQRKGFELSSGEIYGLNSEIDIGKILELDTYNFNFGLSYVNRKQAVESVNNNVDPSTSAYSGRLEFSKDNWYSKLEYVYKSEDALVEQGVLNTNSLNDGNGFLFNTGFSKRGFGLDVNFRRVENMGYYSDREAAGNNYNEQIINYIPALTNQYDYSLANIYLYQSQYELSFNPLNKAGEIGSQFTMYHSIKRNTGLGGKYGTKLALNVSSWYGLEATYNDLDRSYTSEFLSFGERYFSEFNLEMRKKWSKNWSGIFNIVNLYYNKRLIEETTGEVNATLLLTDLTYNFQTSKSLRFEAQHLWTKDDKKNWLGATVELNLSSNWSFFVADLYNYGNENEQIHYYNLGGSYSKNGTRVSLNYGRQRGGLLCVGGVCRVVPETTGFGCTLSTTF